MNQSTDLLLQPLPARILNRIDARGCCWIWTGTVLDGGYGYTSINGRMFRIHRLVWMSLVGEIPQGLTLDHLCRNRLCCNPDHLEPVTMAENLRRSPISFTTLNLAKTECPSGHPYSGTNLYTAKDGRRMCRECLRASSRRSYHRAKVNRVKR